MLQIGAGDYGFSPEIFSLFSEGVERNLLVKRFIKEIIYSPETIKITLFYLENLKDFQFSQTKESHALLSQGRTNFLGVDKEIPFPPQQREFVFDYTGGTRGNRTLA